MHMVQQSEPHICFSTIDHIRHSGKNGKELLVENSHMKVVGCAW